MSTSSSPIKITNSPTKIAVGPVLLQAVSMQKVNSSPPATSSTQPTIVGSVPQQMNGSINSINTSIHSPSTNQQTKKPIETGKVLVKNLLLSVEDKEEQKKKISTEREKDTKEYKQLEQQILQFMEENDTDRVVYRNQLFTRIRTAKLPRITMKEILKIVSREYGEKAEADVKKEIKRLNAEYWGDQECLLFEKKSCKIQKVLILD